MRRALVLGVAGAVLAAGIIAAVTLPAQPAPASTAPHITRIFIPAIKAACIVGTIGPTDTQIGFTFTAENALRTIDQDGSLTGIPASALFRINTCLAKYPIEQTAELPHDRYSRELFYDYYARTLKPCLQRETGKPMPDLPARSDFVIRLYIWDPYPSLARRMPLDDLLDLAAACPAVPSYLLDSAVDASATVHPMSTPAQQDCFTMAGIITYPAESWGVRGIYLNVFDPEGNVVAALNTQVTGTITGRSVLDCLHGVS